MGSLHESRLQPNENSGGASAVMDVFLVIAALGVGLIPSMILGDPRWGPVAILTACTAVAALIRFRGRQWAEFGLFRPPSYFRMALIVLAAWLAISVILALVIPVLTQWVPAPDLSAAEFIKGNTAALVVTLIVAWTTAAFGEEIVFRGFLFVRLSEWFGPSRIAKVSALIGQSILFGVSHFYQGISGVLITSVVGLLLGVAFTLGRRNIWAVVLAHGILDSISLVVIYLGLFPTAGSPA